MGEIPESVKTEICRWVPTEDAADDVIGALLGLPAPDRLALAAALAGPGHVVVEKREVTPDPEDDYADRAEWMARR